MFGLVLAIAATAGAEPIADQFFLCDSCRQPAEFSKEITGKAFPHAGTFRSLVGNPDSGVIYVVDYVVKEGSAAAEVIATRRANDIAETQFKEIVAEARRSRALLGK